GPESKSSVLRSAPLRTVTRHASPWAAQQRQLPLRTHVAPRRRVSPASSVSTYSGTEDKLSVTLSTSTRISTLSTGSSALIAERAYTAAERQRQRGPPLQCAAMWGPLTVEVPHASRLRSMNGGRIGSTGARRLRCHCRRGAPRLRRPGFRICRRE